MSGAQCRYCAAGGSENACGECGESFCDECRLGKVNDTRHCQCSPLCNECMNPDIESCGGCGQMGCILCLDACHACADQNRGYCVDCIGACNICDEDVCTRHTRWFDRAAQQDEQICTPCLLRAVDLLKAAK